MDVIFPRRTRPVRRVNAASLVVWMVGMYGLYDMKTLRIVNEKGVAYVERGFLGRRIWFRVTPKYGSNIEAWNWVRRQGAVNLITKR